MTALILIIIYVAFISLGLPDSLLGSAWPIMYQGLGVTLGTAGILTMIVSCGTIISSFFSGRILHRFGTAKVTFVSVFMTAIALLGISFSPNIIWMVLLAIPLGLGAGSVDAGLNSYIATHYKSHHMSWLHCFWGIGAMGGPMIMSQYMLTGGAWRKGYLTIAIVQFVLVFFLFLALPIWSKTEKALLSSISNASSMEASSPEYKRLTAKQLLNLKGVKPIMLSFFLYCAIESTVGLWGSSYLVEIKGVDAALAAQWISLFYGGITLGRFFNGFLTLKLNNKTLIRMGEIIILVGIVFLFLPLPRYFLVFGFILIGLGCAPIYPCMLHETPNNFGKENAQGLMGIQMAVAYSSITLLPMIFGYVAEATTMSLYPYVVLVYAIVIFLSSERVNLIMKKR